MVVHRREGGHRDHGRLEVDSLHIDVAGDPPADLRLGRESGLLEVRHIQGGVKLTADGSRMVADYYNPAEGRMVKEDIVPVEVDNHRTRLVAASRIGCDLGYHRNLGVEEDSLLVEAGWDNHRRRRRNLDSTFEMF